jgi:SagB-type dehydrogenase family enzyme
MKKSIYEPLEPDFRVFRDFLKHFPVELIPEDMESDQDRAKPCPPIEKDFDPNCQCVKLPPHENVILKKTSIIDIFNDRVSRRAFSKDSIKMEELSFLLWATQGLKKTIPVKNGYASLRTVPSAGARHPFETYLIVSHVEGLDNGKYRYSPGKNVLVYLAEGDFTKEVTEACYGQRFCGNAAVTFFWSVIPYRTEWRYGYLSHKVIALDAGHVCQNLYLACETLSLGACAVGAYDQHKSDALFDLDGNDEFITYIAPVGKY